MLEPVRDLEGPKGSPGGVEVPGLPGLLLAGPAHQPGGGSHGGDQAARHPRQTVIGPIKSTSGMQGADNRCGKPDTSQGSQWPSRKQ